MTRKLIFISIILLLFIGGYIYFAYEKEDTEDYGIKTVELKDINKLMIVAHPDDETIWGGGHLLEDDYLVVCITCGGSKKRVEEFKSAMNITEDKYMMLNYPDKTNGQRDNWEKHKGDITKDLKQIIKLKEWDTIITHNPKGEYGHIHHELLSEIVTDLVEDDKIYYFGYYYSKSKIEEVTIPRLEENLLKKKLEVLKVYKSQDFIDEKFSQMYPYENWVKHEEWKELYE